MIRKKEIIVDIQKKTYNEIFLKQMDTTVFDVKILDNNVIAEMTGQTIDILFTKPNNTIVQQLAQTVDEVSGIATIPLLADCLRQHRQGKNGNRD